MSALNLTDGRRAGLMVSSLACTGILSAGEPGAMSREFWLNLPGGNVTDFTTSPRYWQSADSVSTFAGSAAASNAADSYASRVRAYVTAPVSGAYTFWIASDDSSELWLAPTESKFGRFRIASVSGWVGPQAWDAKSSQKSAPIQLVAGQRYFIEALHKDGGGADHLAIAWQVPGGTRELVPASALESFTADPNDGDNDELPDDWESTHGFSLTDNGAAHPSQHPLADPDRDGYTNLEESQLATDPGVRGGLPGALLLETWNGIGGTRVEDLTYQPRYSGSPDRADFLFSAETPVNRADNYGARLRGYVIAPATGDYTFYLSGDDDCQLWLAPDADQFGSHKAAWISGWTSVRQWTKYASQKSQVYSLQAGQRVYLEALQKEAGGGDHLEIGWTTPGSSSVTVIPGSALESYAYDANDADGDNMPDDWEDLHGLDRQVNDAAADPDQDAIPNHLEASFHTDPQMKNTIPGALLHETWLNVPGYHVAALTSSPKYLQPPDFRSLATSAQTFSQPYDAFGSRLRGYLTAPATGTYTFWVQGDDETELWLSSSDSKFDKQLLVRPTLNTSNFDTDLSQKSAPVALVAGQRYYIEALHKDYYGGDFCQIAWVRPGAAREIISGEYLESFTPVANDRDDDDLPDDWEAANGLSPHDNGSINSGNGSGGDLDGDGLLNAVEWKADTRADLSDTDGDGVSDHDEIELLETHALAVDAAPFEPLVNLLGDSYESSTGEWEKFAGKANQLSPRGTVEYPFSVVAAGIYKVEVAFACIADAKVSPDYEIVISIDGKAPQRVLVPAPEGALASASILTPWLKEGAHTVQVFVDNSYQFRRAGIERVRILAARGGDSDGNGNPDWVDARLAARNSMETASQSQISPACIEGRGRWADLITINGSSPETASDDRWYKNVDLDDQAPTTLAASLENGAIVREATIEWVPVNLLAEDHLIVRPGDSLLLTAFRGEAASVSEGVSIEIGGETRVTTADSPLKWQFQQPGDFSVHLTHENGGQITSKTVVVTVVSAPIAESPVCMLGDYRKFDTGALPGGVSLHLDDRIEVRDELAGGNGATSRTLRLSTQDDRWATYRIGTSGPILGTLRFRSARVRSGAETGVYYSHDFGDGTHEISMPMILDGCYPDLNVDCEIFIGGVVFPDGSLKTRINGADLVASGGHTILKFLKAGASGSNCHRFKFYQNSTQIGSHQ